MKGLIYFDVSYSIPTWKFGLQSGSGTGGENSPNSVATFSSAQIRVGNRDDEECGGEAGEEIMDNIMGFKGCW